MKTRRSVSSTPLPNPRFQPQAVSGNSQQQPAPSGSVRATFAGLSRDDENYVGVERTRVIRPLRFLTAPA